MGKREAEGLLARLRTGRPIVLPEENPAAPGVKPADEAGRLVDEGMVHEWDKRLYDAVANYEKAGKLYADTPAAADAARRLKLLLGDPTTRAIVVRQKMETECLRWIEMGELYEKIGCDEEAAKSYGKVLESYPDSDFAADVRRRLTDMERRHLRGPQ
jgi:tetratricopeptide (TPR) repeat protein